MATHCQICGRAIKANSKGGIRWSPRSDETLPDGSVAVALHGYRRPGQGWQTASCEGARWRPYEQARDAILPAIDRLFAWVQAAQARRLELQNNPPAVLESESRSSWRGASKTFTYPRPEGFDAMAAMDTTCYVPHGSYLQLFQRQVRSIQADIKAAHEEIARLNERYDNWVAPNGITKSDRDLVAQLEAK